MNQIKQTTIILAMVLFLNACAAPITDAPVVVISPSPTLPVFKPTAGSTVMVADGTITVDGTAVAESTFTATPDVVELPDYLLDIPILTEAPKSWEEVPHVQMVDVESGAFAEAIELAYADGRIEPFGEGVPVFKFKLADLTSIIFTKYGFGPLYEQVLAGRPHSDMFVGAFIAVDSDGQEWRIFPQLLKSSTGVDVLLNGGPFEDSQNKPDISTLGVAMKSFTNPGNFYTISYYRDAGACAKAIRPGYPNFLKACETYVMEDQAEVVRLVNQWYDTGEFPPELSRFLLWYTASAYR